MTKQHSYILHKFVSLNSNEGVHSSDAQLDTPLNGSLLLTAVAHESDW